MTTVIESNYQQLNPFSEDEDEDHEETARDTGVMIHVVPESEKSRWNHIEDLDSFFTRMYHYHQKHGFACMMLQEVFELGQFIFVLVFSTFLFHCVDYSILFKERTADKISISDAILPSAKCLESMGLVTWISILVASIFWILRVIKVLYHIVQFWDIKSFFNIALKINDSDLDNLTWHEVQKRVIEVQKEQEMCIHKRELTELDIYHRILRFKNYTVAMINKSLLPLQLTIPLFGNTIFMSRGLKYNLELLLFWGPWSPFENSWHLQEDYKRLNKRQELAKSLSKHILWVGIANFILCPLIFFWQILYSFFNYGELLKREPGALGTRMWSLYGRIYLRHFNELDHELNARLNRAYRPASKYMNMFTSPLMTVIARNIAFVSGSIFAVFIILTFYDEDFLTVEHVLMIMTITGSIAAICRSLIPDENLVWCPESLLTAILAHTHYRPDKWRKQAHTQATKMEVAQLFQYRAVHLFEELLSPLLTPYILCFRLRYRAIDIVDFYRNFTVEVTGVGDVCSFAQMDIRKHGNPMWQTVIQNQHCKKHITKFEDIENEQNEKDISLLSNQYTQAEDGKTELSLLHFTLTNPQWKPTIYAENFVNALRERAKREATSGGYSDTNPLYASLTSLSNLGPEYSDIVSNIIRNSMMNQIPIPNTNNGISNYDQQFTGIFSSNSIYSENLSLSSRNKYGNKLENVKALKRGVHKVEGPLDIGEKGLLYSLKQIFGTLNDSVSTSALGSGYQDVNTESIIPLELTAVDMSLSTLYLHELHHRQVQTLDYQEENSSRICQQYPNEDLSILPELRQERVPLLLHQSSSFRNNDS